MGTTCSYCRGEFPDDRLTNLDRGTIISLCPACLSLAETTEQPRPLAVRQVLREDLELVLAWRNNPRIYEHFQNQDSPLTWDDHVSWFESRPSERDDYVIRYEDRPVGVVSINSQDFVSIYIGEPSLWGSGIGTRMLTWIIDRYHPTRHPKAEIHIENNRSQQLFARCGFEQIDQDGSWQIYEYTND